MALTRPVLLSMVAFDATSSATFTFTATGSSSQITANRLIIRNNTSNVIVYNEQQESFRYEHTVPAGTLTNGTYYNATITTYDANGDSSTESIAIQFWCYSNPIISINNIPSTGLIENSNFEFNFTYTQSEGEPLDSYRFNLYNSAQSQISTSGLIYVNNGTPPYDGSYTFGGFENNVSYYIELVIYTIYGTEIKTPQTQFTVRYGLPDLFTVVELFNNCEEGYITVTSNMSIIEGDSYPYPPNFIDNKELNLTNPTWWAQWNIGYEISGDFLLRAWFRNPNPNSTIIRLSNSEIGSITFQYIQGYPNVEAENPQAYIVVTVTSLSGQSYTVLSNFIDVIPVTEQYCMWFTRINGLYNVQLMAVSNTQETNEGGEE